MPDPTITQERRDALVDRLFDATVGALELMSVHIGWRLGLYKTLADGGALTNAELAHRGGIAPRYAREWLEQQAVAGFIEVEDEHAPPEQRRFSLPPEHVEVFTVPDSSAHVAPFAPMVVGIAGTLPEVIDAYRTGAGVPYSRYGPDFRDGQGAINRPAFVNELGDWLASVPEIDRRLRSDPPARVADVGCGQGYSTAAIARAYPRALVTGIDSDEDSVADARDCTASAELDGRLGFTAGEAADLATSGPYDLVCVLEALHDMSDPVGALAAARAALAPGGSLFLMDERVADDFTAPGDPVERVMYGWSVLHCLPSSLAEQPSAALGTALRAGTVRELGRCAGFRAVEVLPIENDFFRFYQLKKED